MPAPLVIAAHGTASEAGQQTIARLSNAVAAARPSVIVAQCFLDVLGPDLATTLGRFPDAVVVPALLSTGYHVLKDIPTILANFPRASVTPHLGPDRALSIAVADRLTEAESISETPSTDIETRSNGCDSDVLLVASGSTVPAAADDLAAAAADLAALTGRRVIPHTLNDPLAEVLGRLTDPVVATYLLAEGFFYRRLSGLADGRAPVSGVIGAHPAVVELILRRYDVEVSARL